MTIPRLCFENESSKPECQWPTMLYQEGSRILTAVKGGNGTLKSLCLSSKYNNKKQLYALMCETLKYEAVLKSIIEAKQLLKLERKALKGSCELAQVLLYDFLLGKGIKAASPNQQAAISKHKAALQSELARLKVKAGAATNKDLLPNSVKDAVKLPRYVRVNLLKTTVNDVCHHFRTEGYKLISVEGLNYARYIDVLQDLKKKEFAIDLHLPDLLTFAPGTDLHDHVLYERGDIILQDKASCVPAHVLNPPPGSHVIDCCAAPGNKTTHVASLLANKGKVFSFDKDPKRIATMNTMTLKAGVLIVKVKQQDFLKVDPCDPLYNQVKFLIVDPSCSGSGIVNRLGHLTDKKESSSSERLENLAAFQLSILLHAMSFPQAQRVVYSTCSIHETENENVVHKALLQMKGKFKLAEAIPALSSRGHTTFPGGVKCLRLSPEKDLCNGFFVACFERTSEGEVTNDLMDTESEEISPNPDPSQDLNSDPSQTRDQTRSTLQGVENSSSGNSSTKKKKKNKKRKQAAVDSDSIGGKDTGNSTHGDTLSQTVVDDSLDVAEDSGTKPGKKLKVIEESPRSGPVLQNTVKSKSKKKKHKHRKPLTK